MAGSIGGLRTGGRVSSLVGFAGESAGEGALVDQQIGAPADLRDAARVAGVPQHHQLPTHLGRTHHLRRMQLRPSTAKSVSRAVGRAAGRPE